MQIAFRLIGHFLKRSLTRLATISPEPSTGNMVHLNNILTTDEYLIPKYSVEEVQKHNSESSSWMIIDGNIYDVTNYTNHPGGQAMLFQYAGKDASVEFELLHQPSTRALLKQYLIGTLSTDIINEVTETVAVESCKVEMKCVEFIIQEKRQVTVDSFRYILSPMNLDAPRFELPVGQHVIFKLHSHEGPFMRAYTPIAYDISTGIIEFVIKVYPAVVGHVLASRIIGDLNVGDTIEMEGPRGFVKYLAAGELQLHRHVHKVKRIVAITGGTGIAPIYQILTTILHNPRDFTEVYLLYSNRSEDDVLLGEELFALSRRYCKRISIFYTFTNSNSKKNKDKSNSGKEVLMDKQHHREQGQQEDSQVGGGHLYGRIDATMIRQYLPTGAADTFALLCGPPGLLDVCSKALLDYNYDREHCVYF